ncbi:ricin-type beta-trefoil lectin domain protein [Kitasatospora albolonga]|uniref:ricin-type beta-trefoil lectin domain protein n=1 Tax=Kitasatospora albolonga TaxID=68173 RepID=UPI0031F17170
MASALVVQGGIAARASDDAPSSLLPTAAQAAAIDAAHAKDQSPPSRYAEQFTQAKAGGKNVLIEALSTEFSETYATPDGHLQLTSHPDQQRMKSGGTWRPLDATLAAAPGGGFAPTRTPSGVVLSSGGSGPLAILTSPDGKKLAIGSPFALPAPKVEGDSLLYPAVLPETDLRVTVGKSGSVSTVLVVKTPAAAANPALKKLRFSTKADGVTVKADANNNLTADAADGPRWTAPAPTMWDSSAPPAEPAASGAKVTSSASQAEVQGDTVDDSKAQGTAVSSADGPGSHAKVARMPVTATADGVELVPDQNLLSIAKFPVFVDPNWLPWNFPSNGNTFVQSAYRSEGHYNVNGSAVRDHLGVGYCDNSYPDGCSPSSLYRAFYQFDTSALQGAIINSARIDAWEYVSANWSCTAAYGVDVFWVNGAIGPGTNWDNQPQPFGGRLNTASVAGSGHNECYNNRQVAWSDLGSAFTQGIGTNSTITIGLRASNEGQAIAFKRFDYGAVLTVTFDRVPEPPNDPQLHPVPSSVTGGENQGCGAPWGGWSWIGAGSDAPGAVSISSTVRSPVNQDLLQTRTLMWDYNNNGAAPPGDGMSQWTPNNQRATYTVPGGYIRDGHAYAYHQQTTDLLSGASWSGFGPQCTFAVDQTIPQVRPKTSPVDDLDHEFPPSGIGQTTKLFVNQSGYIVANAVDNAPGDGLFSSGLACLRWSFDPQLNGAQWQCGNNLPPTEGASNYKLAVTPKHWGTNVVYIEAKDNANNTSPIAQYAFYAPWNPNGPPPVFGDVTGDGAPDMVTVGLDGNLRAHNVPGNATATDPSTSVLAYKANSPNGDSWAGVRQITHRGSTRGGTNVDDIIAHADNAPELYVYPNGSTADGIIGHFGPTVGLTKPTCQITQVNKSCEGYYGGSKDGAPFGDWSRVEQIAALGDISTTKLDTNNKFRSATGMVTVEKGGDDALALWFYPALGASTFAPPVKLGGANWSGQHLMSPGDWTGKGNPGLWSVDANGYVSGYTLTVGTDTSTVPGNPPPTLSYPVVTAVSAPIPIGQVNSAKYDVTTMQSDGDLSGRGTNGSALWATDRNNPGPSNLTTWFGKAILDGNNNPTGYNWDIKEYGMGNISTPPEQWPFGTKDRKTGTVSVDGKDTLGVNPMTIAGSGVTFGTDRPGTDAELGSVEFGGNGVLTSLPQGGASPATLTGGAKLEPGQQVDSENATLTMQKDGNLVLAAKNSGRPLWSSQTWGHPGATATLQVDGNFVIHDGSTPIWHSNTYGHPGAVLKLQNDRNLVLYDGATPLWSSNTYQHAAPGIVSDTSYTVSAWVKLDGTTGYDQSVICQQGNTVPSVQLNYRDATHSWSVMTPSQDSNSATWVHTDSAAGTGYTGAWTHIAATYSADAKILTFYLNGTQVGSTSMPWSWVANRETTIGGCYFNNDHSKIVNQLKGKVSDVRSYPFQLTPSQVSGLYNAPKQALYNTATQKCLDDLWGKTSNGNSIQIWDCNGTPAQQVSFIKDGAVHLLGKCLDAGAGTAGTPLKLWDCNGTGPQKFTLSADGSLKYTPNGSDSGLCVDVPNGDTTPGTRLQLYSCNGTNAQRWTIK